MRFEIRPVAPAEWRPSRDLRLTSLQDPLASVAFARSYAEESAMTDEKWQQRASGAGSQQFVALADDRWVGMTVVVVERADYLSVNAVYLLPEFRGLGLADQLFAAASAWAWEHTDRLHLWVHERNPRAEAFYRRRGFVRTGRTDTFPTGTPGIEHEMLLLRPTG